MMNKKSRIITILTCITGDAAFFYWIYFSFTKMERFKGLLAQALVMHQMTLNDVSESDLQQLFSVMVNSLITALIFFSLFHLVVYTMFYFEKKAAIILFFMILNVYNFLIITRNILVTFF